MVEPEIIKIEDTMSSSYINYANAVNNNRAFPSALDGLKPVHRNILVALHDLKMTSSSFYKKSARVVGDTIGKYHPHGDNSVYDAMTNMSQDFKTMLPLIDGQGNFGSIDGDSPAAMRYTEVRPTPTGASLIDTEFDVIPTIENYDSTLSIPTHLPTKVPLLVINGSFGVGVAMSNSIPPSNPIEALNLVIAYLKTNGNLTINEVLDILPAPDLPTGGIIYGTNGVKELYETGEGRFKMRGTTHLEEDGTNRYIIIDSIPFGILKSKLIKDISVASSEGRIPDITDIRDDSDRNSFRISIRIKKGSSEDLILTNLYKRTNLEYQFNGKLSAVSKYGNVEKYTLLELIGVFVNFRKNVLLLKFTNLNTIANNKLHISEGYLIAIKNIVAIVKLIQSDILEEDLYIEMNKLYSLSEKQVKSILDMKLRKLRGLEKNKISNEIDGLNDDIKYYTSLFEPQNLINFMIKEQQDLIEVYKKTLPNNGKRQTEIIHQVININNKDLIPNIDEVVTITKSGYIKKVALSTYNAQLRGGKGKIGNVTHSEDFTNKFIITNTHSKLLIFTNYGKVYWLDTYEVPTYGRTSIGKNLVNLIDIDTEEVITSVIAVNDFTVHKHLIFVTSTGLVKRTNIMDYAKTRKSGIIAIKLKDKDSLVKVDMVDTEKGKSFLNIVTVLGQTITFSIDELRVMGRDTMGVIGISFKLETDCVIDSNVIYDLNNTSTLTITDKGYGKQTKTSEFKITKRGGSGVKVMKLNSRRTGNNVIGSSIVDENMDVLLLTKFANVVRVKTDTIRKAGRVTMGVKVVDLSKPSDKVILMTTCLSDRN